MRSLERPPAKLRARGLPGWLPWLARGHQHVSIWKKLWPIVVSVSGTMLRGRRLCWRRRWPIERLSRPARQGICAHRVEGNDWKKVLYTIMLFRNCLTSSRVMVGSSALALLKVCSRFPKPVLGFS